MKRKIKPVLNSEEGRREEDWEIEKQIMNTSQINTIKIKQYV